MPEALVANASPLIVLARIGQLDLLMRMSGGVLITDEVATEILAGPESDPAKLALASGWGTRISVRAVPEIVRTWNLGDGEASVVAAALEASGRVPVLDDSQARVCARALGLRITGTLGLVIRAKLLGHVPSAAQVILRLQGAGLFLEDALIRDALARTTGEKWKH